VPCENADKSYILSMSTNKILALAIDEMKQKNFSQAKLILESLITKNPCDIDVIFCLGRCTCKMKNYEQAIEHFENCIMINSSYTKAYQALHCIYKKTGILQKAAIDGEPIGKESHRVYLDRALLFLEDINKRCPDIPEVLISFGKVLEKKREFVTAANCYQRIIQVSRNQKFTNLAKESLARIRIREIIEKGQNKT
jgi:tetratricopeptide (TPR) repeat protein